MPVYVPSSRTQAGATFPYYENADCFLLVSGLEILARARTGDADGALQQLLAFMEQYVATTFWGQRYSWREQRMKGGDILANALLGLVGGLVGAFGISSNLSAVSVANRPAAALEGFKWRFLHLGEEVEVSVVNGSTVITKVTGQRPDSTQSE